MINRRLLQAMLAAAVFAGSVNVVSAAAAPKKTSHKRALPAVLMCACVAALAAAAHPEMPGYNCETKGSEAELLDNAMQILNDTLAFENAYPVFDTSFYNVRRYMQIIKKEDAKPSHDIFTDCSDQYEYSCHDSGCPFKGSEDVINCLNRYQNRARRAQQQEFKGRVEKLHANIKRSIKSRGKR